MQKRKGEKEREKSCAGGAACLNYIMHVPNPQCITGTLHGHITHKTGRKLLPPLPFLFSHFMSWLASALKFGIGTGYITTMTYRRVLSPIFLFWMWLI